MMRHLTRALSLAVVGGLLPCAPVAIAQNPVVLSEYSAPLVATTESGTQFVQIRGRHLSEDPKWTARVWRYYVRRSGEAEWKRLFVRPVDDEWYEKIRDVLQFQANGSVDVVTWDEMRVWLQNDVFARRAGTLELVAQLGAWSENGFSVKSQSNVIRIPIQPAPQAPPTVREIKPARVEVLSTGGVPAQIRIVADNLAPDAKVTLGAKACQHQEVYAGAGEIHCDLPLEIQRTAGMYLVNVTTSQGSARRQFRLYVDAPLTVGTPLPHVLAATDSAVKISIPFTGSMPETVMYSARGSAWVQPRLENPRSPRKVDLVLPPGTAAGAGVIEFRLENGAGAATARVLVCGGAGPQPSVCKTSQAISRGKAVQSSGRVVTPESPPALTRKPPKPGGEVELRPQPEPPGNAAALRPQPEPPGLAVSLRPQPEPPGLSAFTLAPRASLALASGRRLAWRSIDNKLRLVLLNSSGKTAYTFAPGATIARSSSGEIYVRVGDGAVSLGRRAGQR